MYVQYIILLSSYHCAFILFKSEIISYAKKWHIILLTYSTANNKHWRKKIFFCYKFTTVSWKITHLFTSLSCEGVWQAERGSKMQTQTNWTQTASLLKLENKLKTTRKANTTKTRDYHDKTGNRQRARDREGERNLTDTQRYDWGKRTAKHRDKTGTNN